MKETTNSPHLIWICPTALTSKLDAATWLDITRELRQMGWDVTLVTSGAHTGIQRIRGIEVFCVSVPEIYLLRHMIFHWRLLCLLRKWHHGDVILFGSTSAPWLLPLRLLRVFANRKRPLFVVDTRSLHMPPKNRQGSKGYLRDRYARLMNSFSIRGADGHTVITEQMAKILHIPPEKLWGVWPSGVDVHHFESCSGCRKWPTKNEPVRLGYIGALEYERNLMGLAIAVERANAEGMSFQFVLVGEGTQRVPLESYARSTPGYIEVIPAIPYEKIPDILSQVHVGVLPFPDEEKFQVCSPIKLFEYMAAGLPILATRISCHTNVIKDGRYAFWAEPEDDDGLLEALRRIWQRRDALKDLSIEAAYAVQGWTWHESAVKLKSALEGGLANNTCPASNEMNALHGRTRS